MNLVGIFLSVFGLLTCKHQAKNLTIQMKTAVSKRLASFQNINNPEQQAGFRFISSAPYHPDQPTICII